MVDKSHTNTLTVAEAEHVDVGRSIARLSRQYLASHNITQGDVIAISSAQGSALALATEAFETDEVDFEDPFEEFFGRRLARRYYAKKPTDAIEGTIRIDGITRANLKISLGEKVTVKKVDAKPATEIQLTPVQKVEFNGDPSDFIKEKLVHQPLQEGQLVGIDVLRGHIFFKVASVSPKGAVLVSKETKVAIGEKLAKLNKETKIPDISYEDIGGLRHETDMIREMVELPMKHPEVFERLGVAAPKGVLLTGPPGTGKTLLAKAVAAETDSHFYSIAGPEIVTKYYGDSEKKLREIFVEAQKNAPSIIFIDEIDSIAPKRGEGADQTEKRIVAQLLTLLDGLQSRGNVVVMAATNRPDDIDEALRRPGRFDRELKILPPNEEGRKEILQIHTRGMPLAKDVDISLLAAKTIGYTGADLEILCKEAALKALAPWAKDLKERPEQVPTHILEKLFITQENFTDALQMVEPSAMREVLINKPKVTWEDIGGLDAVKEELKETIEMPLTRPDLFKQAGISAPKGVLLHGPPGTGKTLLAKAIANEADANFISVKGPELVSKWVGESEKHIREIFKKARQVAPTVIFFDEFDSISKTRNSGANDGGAERMVNQLLTEIDGVEELNDVVLIAATNRPDLIDPALLRPGRIEAQIEIPLPDDTSRKQIIAVHAAKMPLAKDASFDNYVKKTDGWSGADLESFCREAGMNAIRDISTSAHATKQIVTVSQEHIDAAYKKILKKKERSSSTNDKSYIL